MGRTYKVLLIWSCFGWLFSTAYASDVTGDLNNVDSIIDSNNNSTSSTTNYNGAGSSSQTPVPTAMAPAYMSNGQESCLRGSSRGLQAVIIGFSSGEYTIDEECERRRDSTALNKLGMKVAAVSRLCQDVAVFRSMLSSGTPCPILVNGRLQVGKSAMLHLKMNPEKLIPDYFENKELYDLALGIGVKQDEQTEDGTTDNRSISERFRSSRSRSDSNGSE